MVLSDPSWRVKTRSCPFYQQGRCMFSESCNFLHTVSAQVDGQVKRLHQASGSRSPHNPPRVVVDSPQSVCSSPRSPRTTGLLLALGDVVGDPNTENRDEDAPEGNSPMVPGSETWSEGLPTLVNDLGFGPYSRPDEGRNDEEWEEGERFITYEDSDVESDGNWTAISDYDDNNTVSQPIQGFIAETTDEIVHSNLTSPRQALRRGSWTTSPDHNVVDFSDRHSITSATSLLSPIEVSMLRLGTFFQANSSFSPGSNSFDSGYAETWNPPVPLAASPPRSPSVSSMFDPLGSPLVVQPSQFQSSHLGTLMPRSPSSPTRTISPYDIDDEIHAVSDIDSPRSQQDPTTYLTPMGSPSVLSRGEDLDSESSAEDEEFWDSGGTTAVYMGGTHEDFVHQDINSPVTRLSRSPTNLPNAPIDSENLQDGAGAEYSPIDNAVTPLVDNADETNIFLSTSTEALPTLGDDETAYLAYLKSPLASQSTENDTLDSLYSSYSAISFDRSFSSDAAGQIQTPLSPGYPASSVLSSSSTPLSSLRERVFTPPPRKRSGTVTADSPNSSPSPITSLHSSMGRASPFSDKLSGQGSRSQSPLAQDIEVSRKIPIGFRKSFASGRVSTSSLLSNRNNGKSVITPLYNPPESSGSRAKQSGSSSPRSAQSLPKGFKPLRLSTFIDAKFPSRRNTHSHVSSSSINSVYSSRSGNNNHKSISSTSVTSTNSSLENRLLTSNRSSPLPLHIRNSLIPSEQSSTSPLSSFPNGLANIDEPPQSAPVASWRRSINYSRPSSRLSEPIHENDSDDFEDDTSRFSRDPYGETIRRLIAVPHTAPVSRASSVFQQPIYTIETPKPTLMFAIASDDVKQVKDVLARGKADPNEYVGPMSALEFTLTNDKLANKLDIVKTLLAYGADPTSAAKLEKHVSSDSQPDDKDCSEGPRSLMEEMDPATRYYLERADSIHTRRMSVLIQRSFFRPLTRVRYDLIGQDRALEQLFRVLSMHSRELAVSPMVVMLCGPSGHGKSLLARKFGSLLEVPTHTVNMTTLRATHNLWESHSMSPYETPTTCTLSEFLTNNEGKRCVVVLDEIEKTEDPKTLWSLLMPWELGRCAFEAGKRHVDVKNVIWIGTSNVGHDLVFQHRDTRKNTEDLMSREEYVALMALLRPKVSERLGASILSRITTVLPFVPFTLEEKRAICSEALFALGGEMARALSSETVETLIDSALESYCEEEGARSLHRAISNHLVDVI